MIKIKIEIPKPNLKWYNSSKKELLEVVKQHHQESWNAESDPVTQQRWKPRKEPTGGHPLLRKSGKMLNSTNFKADSHPMLFKATTNVSYGKYHQTGTSRMPRRRWLGLGGGFEEKFVSIVSKHVFKGKITYSIGN